MRSRIRAFSLLAIFVLASAAGLAQAEDLSGVYAAILRGDPGAGQTEIKRLRDKGASDSELARVETWVNAFQETNAARRDMKSKTFDWAVEQGKKALADNEIYFALTFADRAAAYAPDEDKFAEEDWVKTLTQRAEEIIAKLKAEERWTRAVAYQSALLRLHPDDKALEDDRERSARRARLTVLYESKDKIKERIEGVNADMLSNIIRRINRDYYEEPDFKQMANGALANLRALAETSKLHEFLDGLGNPAARKLFLKQIDELEQKVRTEERFTYRDLINLYRDLSDDNLRSVEIPDGLLVVEFLEGAVQELDPYTSMVWPVDIDNFNKIMMGNFEGVGIQLGTDEPTGRLKVVTPLEDSPALEAGIQPGDLIIQVDGKSTKGWDTDDAVTNIMGPAGSDVVLTIQRPSTGQEIPFKLTRREIILKTVRGVERLPDDPQNWEFMLDDGAGIAYIRLSGFHPDSHKELVEALKKARDEGMRGLILDVRHNPGGMLDVAIRIVSTFLREGEVVSTGGRTEPRTSLQRSNEPFVTDVPLVVLVDESSASASEILAGALKDHNRAIVLGERSFGKGSVQRVHPIGGAARLKLTTSLYYLPDGRSPHKEPDAKVWGVDPNWEIKLTPKEFAKIIERENESFIIHDEHEAEQPELSKEEREALLAKLKDEDKDDEDEPPLLTDEQIKALDADPVEAPDADPQLATALLLLRVKLAGDLPWPQKLAANVDEMR